MTASSTAWNYSLLACVVLAISSAATAFKLLPHVPPLVLAHWRLQFTSLLLFPGFLKQLTELPTPKESLFSATPLLLTSGLCLAIHFGLWVYGLQMTSITHALLFVSSSPLVIAAASLAVCYPLSMAEVGGTVLGFVGSTLVALGGGGEDHVTFIGDLSSFGGAIMIIGYLQIGAILRQDLPLLVYAVPVTASAAFFLGLGSWAVDDATLLSGNTYEPGTPVDRPGLLDYFGTWRLFQVVLYLAVGPGTFGHTVMNYLLKHLSPLVISVAVTLEPAVGSVIGWLWGMEAPGELTWYGGVIMLASLVSVAYGHHHRTRLQSDAQRKALQPADLAVQMEHMSEGTALLQPQPVVIRTSPAVETASGLSTPNGRLSPNVSMTDKQV